MAALSMDLRERIVSTYERDKASIRKVAEQFKVSKTTVQNLLKLKQQTGQIRPKPARGGKPGQLLGMEVGMEAEAIAMVEEYPDYTLSEYCELWFERTNINIKESTMCRFLQALKLTRKKTKRNRRASLEEVQKERKYFWNLILQEMLDFLAFLDEMGVLTGIMRDMARSLAGTRAYDFDCIYRGTRINYVGAICLERVLCLKPLPKSMNGKLFKEFVEEDLIPNLWKGAVVVMDNLKAHKVQGVQEMIEAAGAKIIYLPRIRQILILLSEHFWWELKAFLRRFKPKDADSIQKLLELGVLLNSAETRKNYFTHFYYCDT